jgi:hypothetical protein
MISQDDIDDMCGDLTGDEKDCVFALLHAGAKVNNGVAALREFPAEDMRKVIAGGLIAWGLLWQRIALERMQASVSMGVYDRNGRETS